MVCSHKKKDYPLKLIMFRIFNTHCPHMTPIRFGALVLLISFKTAFCSSLSCFFVVKENVYEDKNILYVPALYY